MQYAPLSLFAIGGLHDVLLGRNDCLTGIASTPGN